MADEASGEASPERLGLGSGIEGFREAATNGNALIQELRGTLAAFLHGQYQLAIDTPLGIFKVKAEKVS